MPYINYDGDDTDNGYSMVSYKTNEEDIKKIRLKDYRDIANYKTVSVPQHIKNLEIVGLIFIFLIISSNCEIGSFDSTNCSYVFLKSLNFFVFIYIYFYFINSAILLTSS